MVNWDRVVEIGDKAILPNPTPWLLDLHNRLTVLETARATAPVSDDELVEALAKATFERETPRIWTGGDRSNPWLIEAQKKLDYIRAAGYDVVKRS